jgi:hypothetical protein
MAAIYQYAPLRDNEIRLVSLLPASADDSRIRVDITHVPLAAQPTHPRERLSMKQLQASLGDGWEVHETVDGRFLFRNRSDDDILETHPNPQQTPETYAPPSSIAPAFGVSYEALSYTWGSLDCLESIEVRATADGDAKEPDGILRVGQNLACALRHLRLRDDSRTFWIDSICINQANLEERGSQVARMGQIYGLARRVIAWLGPASSDSPLAVSTLQYLSHQIEVCKPHYFIRSARFAEAEWWDHSSALPYEDATFEALAAFLDRPWFERLWVMQEVQLANRQAAFQCGHDSILVTDMQRAMAALDQRVGIPAALAARITVASGAIKGHFTSWMQVLAYARRRQCSDQRDKIYGVLSLAPPAVAAGIHPQYSSSLSQVYKDAFLAACTSNQRLEFLSLATRQRTLHDLPSWVPDFSAAHKITLSTDYDNRASGTSRSVFWTEDGSILNVYGVEADTIASTSAALLDKEDMAHAVPLRGLTGEPYPTGEDAETAYLRLLRLDWLRERFPQTLVFPTMAEWKEEYTQKFSVSAARKMGEFPDYIFDVIRDSAFCETREGYFGFVPYTSKRGTFCPPMLRSANIIGSCSC